MGAIATFAAVFGPGIVLGIWLGWRQIPWMRGLATAIAITFVWGMVVWFAVFGRFATPEEVVRITGIAAGIAVVNAGVPFGLSRMIRRAW